MDVFLIVSSIVFVVAGLWFLLWPQLWVEAIRNSGIYSDFWTSRIGMTINRALALIAIVVGSLIIIGYVL